jgi:dihydrofolate reductase
MRQLIATEFVSLDGVMQAPGGEPGYAHTGWVAGAMGEEQLAYKQAEVFEAEALLLGRVTYESFAGAWPLREGAFADRMNTMPKHVVSTTMTAPEWDNTAVLAGDPVAAVRELKAGDGGPLLLAGSRTLLQALLRAGLVDELRLMIFPVILGSGDRLYLDAPDTIGLTLVRTQPFATGAVVLHYRIAAG